MEPKHPPHGRMGRRRGHSRSQLMLRHRQQGQVSIGSSQVSKWGLSSSSWFLLKHSCLLPWSGNKLRNIMKHPVGHENPEYVLESTLHTWPMYTLIQTYFRDFNYTYICMYVCMYTSSCETSTQHQSFGLETPDPTYPSHPIVSLNALPRHLAIAKRVLNQVLDFEEKYGFDGLSTEATRFRAWF